jgi:type IV pilus assembly protein PilM
MSILSGVSEFFGLDIGTSAVRVVQAGSSGSIKSLQHYGYAPIDAALTLSESKADQQKVVQIIRDLLAQSRITTKNVAVGIPSQRVFTTVVDIDRLAADELAKTIRFQADSLIPTPLAESKIDWALIGDSPVDQTKVEVLLSSVPNNYVENQLDMLESIGLNVIAFEPDNLALTRAMLAPDSAAPQMVVDISNRSTDIVVTVNGIPRLTRSIPTGSEAIIRAAMQNLNIDEKQAQQFVFKFGLTKEKLEGQVYQAIISTVELIIAEIDKSLKFFQTRYTGSKIERITVTGGASALPEFPIYLANKYGVNIEIGNAWRNLVFPQSQQNELLGVANYFGVAAGLAERNE